MKLNDFNDVAFWDKMKASSLFFYQVAYQEQKSNNFAFHFDGAKHLSYALQNNYCITLIKCPFVFNFDALLNHFAWCCRFMFFNFSETTIRFDILRKIREKGISREETVLLLKTLEENPEPYIYSLDAYEGETKFALIKRHDMDRKGRSSRFLERDHNFRSLLTDALKALHGINELDKSSSPIAPRKYEPSVYGYLRFSDMLTFEQQETVIKFLYNTLKDLFRADYSFEHFYRVFNDENSKPIELDVSKPTTSFLDAQKLHLLFRKLKEQVLVASWDIIRQKIIVYNQAREVVASVYQLSSNKISPGKSRQVNKLLQPVLRMLPEKP
jgi:hypothetical protein